jgi:hypothetical protein
MIEALRTELETGPDIVGLILISQASSEKNAGIGALFDRTKGEDIGAPLLLSGLTKARYIANNLAANTGLPLEELIVANLGQYLMKNSDSEV